MKKKILMIGDCHAKGWRIFCPEIFGHNYDWIFYYHGGNGNQWMSGVLFEHIEKFNKPDYVYLMFSNLTKLDFPVHNEVRAPEYGWQTKKIKRNYIHSGGSGQREKTSWSGNEFTKNIFKLCYDQHDPTFTHDLSWQSIFSAIELCKSLKIDYQWNFFYNITNPPNEYLNHWWGEPSYPTWIDRSNELDINQLNFAYDINMIPDDGTHYDAIVNKLFFQKYQKKFRI